MMSAMRMTTGRWAALAVAGTVLSMLAADAWVRADHHEDGADRERVQQLVARVRPTEGNQAQGLVTFTEVEQGVRILGTFQGLMPNARHAIHIHEYGDERSTDGTSAGGHYNPEGHPHGLPEEDEQRHAGDLGNLETDDQGRATLDLTVGNVTLAGHENPIIGRGVIVHAERDQGTQPVGDAGARVGMGVIGVANPDVGE